MRPDVSVAFILKPYAPNACKIIYIASTVPELAASISEVVSGNKFYSDLEKYGKENGFPTLKISAQVESEIALLEDEIEKTRDQTAKQMKTTNVGHHLK